MAGKIDPNEILVPLTIELAIRFSNFFDFSFFIQKKDGSYIEIEHASSNIKKTFEGYRGRGLKEIFLREEDYQKVSGVLREVIQKKEDLKEVMGDLKTFYDNSRNLLLTLGMSGVTLRNAQDLNRMVIGKIGSVPSLLELLASFKEDCHAEFFKYIVLSFIGTSMVNTFDWQSEPIKTKLGMAAMLCDAGLTQDDYHTMKESEYNSWPKELREHPILVAQKLRTCDPDMPQEVLQMIEHHHELPNGEGYPKKLGFGQIPLLSAVFIVALNFCDSFKAREYDVEQKEDIAAEMYELFTKGNFRNAALALFKCIRVSL